MGVSILDRIKAAKVADAVADKERNLQPEQVTLRGTGLTKREVEKNAREIARQEGKFIKAQEQGDILPDEHTQEFHNAVDAQIAQMQANAAKKNITLDPSQALGLHGLVSHNRGVLIGAAGTGKTTLENMLVDELALRVGKIDLRTARFETITHEDGTQERVRGDRAGGQAEEMPGIAFAAFTGRAVQQMKRSLAQQWHKSCSTIHALLGYAPTWEEVEYFNTEIGQWDVKERRVFRPTFGVDNKLPFKVYFFDEASMIPIQLWNEFIDACEPDARIYLIGDIHQLPPVQGKSVLGYAMRHWPVFELTQIHRQAEGNAIIENSQNVLHGRRLKNAATFHVLSDKVPSGSGEMQTYIRRAVQKLAELKRYNPYTDAIIVPQNKGMIGTLELNPHFVMMFNPEKTVDGVVVNKRINIHTGTEHVMYAIGDKVMIGSNINTVDPPITNGMIGVVDSININGKYDMKRSQVDLEDEADPSLDEDEPLTLDFDAINDAMASVSGSEAKEEDKDQRQSSHVLTIKFESGQTHQVSTAGDYRKIQLAYATTCHKSQGGEYPNVIVVCHSANGRMLSQEWLYTAITRARNNVYLIGNERGIAQALKTQRIKGYTLQEKIKAYVIETGSDDEDHEEFDRKRFPILWPATPVEV